MRIHGVGHGVYIPPLPPLRSLQPAAAVAPVVSAEEIAAIAAARAERLERQRRIGAEEKHKKRDYTTYNIQTVSLKDAHLLPTVVKQFPLIRSLDLHRCNYLEREHFAGIAKLSELEQLFVHGCPGVDLTALDLLAPLAFFRECDIRDCPDLSAPDLVALRVRMPRCVFRTDLAVTEYGALEL